MNRCLTSSLLLLAVVTCAFAQFTRRKPEKKVPEVDQRCMECICQASSNCDESLKCHNAGGNSYFCGPYVISWAYWHDGGRPGDKGRAHDFEACLNNKTCAEQAVRGYMRKYGQDCDGSGDIDCFDFARIHKLGFGSCGGTAIHDSDYWEKFEICYAGYQPDIGGYQPDNARNVPDYAGYQPDNARNVDYDYGAANDDGDGIIQARRGVHN